MYKITRTLLDGTSPSVLTDIPENIRNKFITGPVYGRIYVVDTEENITQDNYLKDFKVSDLRFIPDQGIFGGAVAKELKVNFVNVDKEFTLQDKEIEAYNSVIDEENGYRYEIKYGRFIVQHPETENTTDNTSVTALDYMIKANERYVDTIEYPCSLRQLASNICTQLGITLASESFRNENFSVVDNQFVGGESYRTVIQNIAKSAFSWARIDEDNVLHFDFAKKDTSNIQLGINNYYKLSTDDLVYGPVNRITIRNSQITELQPAKVEDAESIEENGLTELVIYDNYFGYTLEKRNALVLAAESLLGLTYMPVNNMDLTGFCFLNCTDKLNITDLDENSFDTYLFDHTIDYGGIIKDNIQTKVLNKVETKYEYMPETSEAIKRTEIIVDRQKQEITSIIKNIGNRSQKTTTITQDIDRIESEIQDIEDITIDGESNYATVSLDNINVSEPITVKIHPLNGNISYLYPSASTFPSADTFLKVRTLRFTRSYQENGTTKTENIDYELPDDLLFYDSETYDEFYLDYQSQICQIIKKCDYNTDGTVKLLEEPVIETFDYPKIELSAGDYTISLPGYSIGYLYVKLMKENDYTKLFATKVELNTEITQTATNITTSVTQTTEVLAKDINNNYIELSDKIGELPTNSDILTLQNRVETVETSNSYTIGVIEDLQVNGASKVKTETGFTFDNEGLHIEKTGAKTSSTLDEGGLHILDATGSSGENLLFAGYDTNTGETLVKTKNLTVQKYLTIGNYSRIEDYEQGTGVFWIGG